MSTQTMEAPAAQPAVKGIAPYLTVQGAKNAAEFYRKALAAEVVSEVPAGDDGRYMHIHLYINGGSVMLGDAFPEHGHQFTPLAGFSLTLEVKDADAWADRFVKAGGEVVSPVTDMFWGARYGQVRDAFGVVWAFNQPKA